MKYQNYHDNRSCKLLALSSVKYSNRCSTLIYNRRILLTCWELAMKSCRLSIERGRLFMWRYTLFNYTGTSLSIKPSYTYMIDQREKKKILVIWVGVQVSKFCARCTVSADTVTDTDMNVYLYGLLCALIFSCNLFLLFIYAVSADIYASNTDVPKHTRYACNI